MKKLLLIALLSNLTACGTEDVFDNKDEQIDINYAVTFSAEPYDIASPVYKFTAIYTENDIVQSADNLIFDWSISLETEGEITSLYPEQSTQYQFTDAATYKVKLTLVNDTGEQLAKFSRNIEITADDIATAPVLPKAVIDITNRRTSTYVFNSNLSSYSQGPLSIFSWIIEGEEFSGSEISHNFTKMGPQEVHLKVTAKDLTQATTMTSVFVVNETTTPIAEFNYTKDKLEVNFNAAESSNQSSDITSYQWDFGNGDTASNIDTSTTYSAEGPYDITLTVISTEGVTSTKTKTINVYEEASYVTCDVLTTSSSIFKSTDEGQCFSTSPITTNIAAKTWCSEKVQQYKDDLPFYRITPTLTWQIRQQGNNECS